MFNCKTKGDQKAQEQWAKKQIKPNNTRSYKFWSFLKVAQTSDCVIVFPLTVSFQLTMTHWWRIRNIIKICLLWLFRTKWIRPEVFVWLRLLIRKKERKFKKEKVFADIFLKKERKKEYYAGNKTIFHWGWSGRNSKKYFFKFWVSPLGYFT